MRALLFAALVPLAACGTDGADASPGVPGTGSGDARTYAVDGFSAVALRGPDDVDVRVGSAFSVRAEGDAETLAKLKIERDGDTLEIGRVGKKGWNWRSNKGAKIYVTMPRITRAALLGSANLTIDRAESAQFDADLAGSGNLGIGTIAAETATLSIAGSGNLAAGGSAAMLKVSIMGSGDIDATKLAARGAEVSIAGSGSVKASVDGAAKVSVMGSGDVDLGPKARCTTSKMGSGEVRCGG